jgi:hypothetical protein
VEKLVSIQHGPLDSVEATFVLSWLALHACGVLKLCFDTIPFACVYLGGVRTRLPHMTVPLRAYQF